MSTVAPREFVLSSDELRASWMPAAGMLGASLVHAGAELLWQGQGPAEYARSGAFMGVPFLHPWANRLERFEYAAGGRTVAVDPESPLLQRDPGGLPIHGLLTASPLWEVRETSSARLVAVLEFDRAELLAAFPFPHRVEIEVTVAGRALTVATTVAATGTESVPVAFGFHPYLQIPGVPRAEWEVEWPVRRRLLLDERLIPTGETEPVEPIHGPIGDRTYDDGYDGVERGARFAVRAGGHELTVEFTEGYPFAQLFAPPGEEFVCIEPMTAPANALVRGGFAWAAPGEQRRAAFRILCGP